MRLDESIQMYDVATPLVVVYRVQPPKQTKESARRDVIYWLAVGHMFLLCGCGPYVSSMWRSAICFYCVALGHMFLLCGARPYVSIVWLWTICFYCVALGHMFLLCVDHMFSWATVMSHTICSPLQWNRRLVT